MMLWNGRIIQFDDEPQSRLRIGSANDLGLQKLGLSIVRNGFQRRERTRFISVQRFEKRQHSRGIRLVARLRLNSA